MASHDVFQGWLTKRGAKVTSWRRRWFTLDAKYSLSYHESERSKPIRTIPMGEINAVIPAGACGVPFPVFDPERCFGIDTNVSPGGRIFFVFADTVEEAMQWRAFIWVTVMKRTGAEVHRQRAAETLFQYISAHPQAIEHIVGAGAISVLSEISRTLPACKDLYTSVLQLIGNTASKVLV